MELLNLNNHAEKGLIKNKSSIKLRNLIVIILFYLIHFQSFSQGNYERIRISGDLELIELTNNAYVHVSYTNSPQYGRVGSNGLIFINNNEAFLFDTPMTDSLTQALVEWLRDSMQLKITGFVPNHWHVDCMGGLSYLQSQNIESYANQLTIDIAKSKNLPVPDHGFKDSLDLYLGDRIIKCYYPGAAHSLDNIVVWIPSEKILFAGCMIKSMNSRNIGNTADGDLALYPKTIDYLMYKFPDAKVVIPGHGQPGGIELIEHTKSLIEN